MNNHQILIVDDSEMNRSILSEMLRNKYMPLEAENGKQALEILKSHNDIKLVLLDIIMPEMDGLEVLAEMKKQDMLSDKPVIMISSENTGDTIKKAYDLGATDFISRPFDTEIVLRRIENTLLVYAKQEILKSIALEKIYDINRNNELMVEILGSIIAFRNKEGGPHVKNVRRYTEFLLHELMKIDNNKYNIKEEDIDLISMASALHDIGKISIPEEVLNKNGKLTPDEFEIMKKHTVIGYEMLKQLDYKTDEPLVKYSLEITHHHHEQFDGKGYPDGLAGNDIPICAQIVALADFYDALTSERVYKTAFSHEKAIDIILKEEVHRFNPDLIKCLSNLTSDVVEGIHNESSKLTTTIQKAEELMNEIVEQRFKNSL